MMKKVVTLITLALFLCGTMISFAADIDDDALMAILNKADGHPNKAGYTGLLRENLKDNSGINFLINAVDWVLSDSDREKLSQNGITEKDIYASLRDLKSWDVSARMDLVDYVENGQMDQARSLIQNKGVLPSSEDKKDDEDAGAIEPKLEEKDKDKENELEKDKPTVNNPEAIKPTETGATNFKDIQGHWAQANIEKMTKLSMVSGMSADTFAPEASVTRSQMVALISRLLDLKETAGQGEMPFTDIKKADWDYYVVQTAYEEKLVSGTSATTFAPNKPVTREQMMAMVINGLEYKKVNLAVDEHKDLKIYTDYNKISNWALDSVQQGVDLNLIAGKTKTTLDAKGTATRAEAVTILERVYNLLK